MTDGLADIVNGVVSDEMVTNDITVINQSESGDKKQQRTNTTVSLSYVMFLGHNFRLARYKQTIFQVPVHCVQMILLCYLHCNLLLHWFNTQV